MFSHEAAQTKAKKAVQNPKIFLLNIFIIILAIQMASDFFQLYNEENIRGVVTLNEDWELEDFSNTEEVSSSTDC